MKQKGLSAETLKLIACITMLIDHIGAILVPQIWLRVVGRIAFPIYCFLLAEGAHYTRDKKKYGLRLLMGLLLSEIPFDIAFWGRLTWTHQSVMVTLLLGYTMLVLMGMVKNPILKILTALPFYFLADLLNCDYGGQGILFILVFGLAREYSLPLWVSAIALAAASLANPSFPIYLMGISIPIELFCLGAMVPLAFYSGRKATKSKAVQWAFYFFYPGHLAVLAAIRILIYYGIIPY